VFEVEAKPRNKNYDKLLPKIVVVVWYDVVTRMLRMIPTLN
jgi:hypothetical protein